MKFREARVAQPAGLISLNQCGFLLGGVAESPAAVGFDNRIIRSIHSPHQDGRGRLPRATPDRRCFGPRLQKIAAILGFMGASAYPVDRSSGLEHRVPSGSKQHAEQFCERC
jgi:hypothetical protein